MEIDQQLANYWVFDRKKFYLTIEDFGKKNNEDISRSIFLVIEYLRLHNNEKSGEVLAALNATVAKSKSSVIVFVFYHHWFLFDVNTLREEEAKIIIKKMEGFIDKDFPEYFKAEYVLCKAMILRGKQAEDTYKKGLSLLPIESDRYQLGIKTLFDQYSQDGRLKDLEPSYYETLTKEFENIFSFIDAVENGQTEEALLLKEKILVEHADMPIPAKIRLENSMNLLDLYLGRFNEKKINGWLQPIKALLDKDLKLALSSANEFYNKLLPQSNITTNFVFFTLIRAQLANKNLDAAKLIIKSWDEEIDWYRFTDFFIARAELLNNNLDKAVMHFTKVLNYCKKNNAMGRLDFELELALELQPKQIRFLMDMANLNLDKKLEIVPPKLKSIPNNSEIGINRIIGNSLAINTIKEDIKKFADLDIPVLILGETGVGKDVVANAIHEESKRKGEPFIAINCSSIAEGLLQSELFGHEAGSYTGASKAHKGIFQEAGNGTVFLDEIGDISSGLQAALLRALESGEYRPVGSAKPKTFRCRIIAATNASLELKVDAGLFRLDLMYRLKRLVLQIPPLRERPIDILQLAYYFLNQNKSLPNTTKMNKDLETALLAYLWPGNVRELKNEMEKMRLLHAGESTYAIEEASFLKDKLKIDPKVEFSALKQNLIVETIKKPAASKEEIFQNSGSYFRRIEAIKKLFEEHKNLSRKEICQITGVPDLTVGRYLKMLIEENFIKKMEPTKSPRTHYFALKI